MKEYRSTDIRNFALAGHGASGKTILGEAMLASGGVIGRMGSINSGNTVSDYHTEEQERKISIQSSLFHISWQGKKFNVLDVPGYTDFIGEVISALRVVDLAAIVIHAASGVEIGTEQVWEYATKYGIPKLFVVNALDKEHVNFDGVLQQIKDRFGNRVFPITLPVNVGPCFDQIIDILRKKILTYKNDRSGKFEEAPVTGELQQKVDKLHEQLIEYVAESDDTLLEKFFGKGELSEDEMRGGLHSAIQNQSLIPLFCTSGETNIGVTCLMDFIAKYGPTPFDHPKIEVNKQDPVLFVFKTVSEAHVGDLSLFRVYSGDVKTGMDFYNSSKRHNERFGQLFSLNGRTREAVDSLHSGDVGAVVKLKDTHTGNTLCSPKKIVELAKIEYPEPNIHMAIKPKTKGDEEKLSLGLATIREEDPTFIFTVNSELRQMVISGQGEFHLDVIAKRLKNRFGIEIETLEPRIPYRETIRGKGDSKYRHRKQSGGAGQFAEVWVRVEPLSETEEVEFTNSLVGSNVDRVFVPSVEKGVKAACSEGVLAGYRVAAVKVDFYDGKQHPVDSKDIAFQIAGKHAFREAFMNAKPCFLEPIINVEVKVPEEFMGDVMGHISGRRGKILGMDREGGFQVIKAKVPQAEMHRYSTTLRSLTGGRGIHRERFSHYQFMPTEIAQKVIESNREKEKSE